MRPARLRTLSPGGHFETLVTERPGTLVTKHEDGLVPFYTVDLEESHNKLYNFKSERRAVHNMLIEPLD